MGIHITNHLPDVLCLPPNDGQATKQTVLAFLHIAFCTRIELPRVSFAYQTVLEVSPCSHMHCTDSQGKALISQCKAHRPFSDGLKVSHPPTCEPIAVGDSFLPSGSGINTRTETRLCTGQCLTVQRCRPPCRVVFGNRNMK